MSQETFLQAIRQKIGHSKSLIDELARVLDISYDAAHRRASLKSKFNIDETILLAKSYGLSLDNLFQNEEYVLVNKTKEIKTFEDLSSYLSNSFVSLSEFENKTSTSIFYSAKDIPLFYTLGVDILSQFKRYVWMNLLTEEQKNLKFEDFQFKANLLQNAENLMEFHENITKHEIWNDTTINSTLQQIMYFYESGMLTTDTASKICDSLTQLIENIEEKCQNNNSQYNLYFHDLLILNNNVLITNNKKGSLFVPYTMLGYFITKDEQTCKNSYNFFIQQLKSSKLLNTAGVRDKKIFFNRMYQKIKFYKDKLTENYISI